VVIIMQDGAPDEQIQAVIRAVEQANFHPHPIYGVNRTVIAVVGDRTRLHQEMFETLPGVDSVALIDKPYKLAHRRTGRDRTVVRAGDVAFGGTEVPVMAGPCAVESEEQIDETVRRIKAAGARVLRGGAFKPRTSPYAFQGMKVEGLKLLADAREKHGLPICTEVMDPRDVATVAEYSDILQIGTRNMQNFPLLTEVGQSGRTVLLKRGMASTIEDFLMAAEYILSRGHDDVLLCERGIRTFETRTRNTLDLSAIPILQRESHLPVIIDPSHATGHWWMVPAMAKAAVAAGADGLLIEVHPNPPEAYVDGPQSLTLAHFDTLMAELHPVAQAVGRGL
jgi:3-deoxy-7-phosphoheptulonate synthase